MEFARFSAILHDASRQWAHRRSVVEETVRRSALLVFGFGGKGRTLAEQLRQLAGQDVHVFDRSPSRRALARELGFPVLDALPVPGSGWATILAACQAQQEQRRDVQDDVIFFQEAATFFGLPHLGHLASDFQQSISQSHESLYEAYCTVHPDSRSRFLAVLRFRASLDPTELAAARAPVEAMWVDIPRRYATRDYRTVMDIGAFDGDTLRSFRTHFSAERGIAVEANAELFASIHEVASQYPRGLALLPCAAWSKETRLRFEEVRSGMIRVSEALDGALAASRMDSHVHEPVDFIKMDIEGAESEALEGCAGIITRSLPDLALAAYHRPNDMVELMRQSQALGYSTDRFDWHLGHYSDCLDDTILYATERSVHPS